VVALVAAAAGATLPLALRLGVSAGLLQVAVGALGEAGRSARTGPAAAVGLAASVAGLGLALAAGPPLLLAGAALLALGAWHALRAQGTRIGWLPSALGLPLLPVYGWLGATGTLPPSFRVLVPAWALAGAALAISAAVAEAERDRAAGADSVALWLGPRPASALALLLQAAVAAIAVATGADPGSGGPWTTALAAAAALPVAGAALGVLVARRGPAPREIAFEVQAVGLALLAVAWVSAGGAPAGA